MVEPAAVAMHAARISGIEPGDLVVVVGAGLIGILAMQAARTLGAGAVAIADIVPERLELARTPGRRHRDRLLGAASPPRSSSRRPGRRTADVVLEAVGIQATIDLATALTRPGGSLTLIGNVQPRVEQDLQGIVSGELDDPRLVGERRGVPGLHRADRGRAPARHRADQPGAAARGRPGGVRRAAPGRARSHADRASPARLTAGARRRSGAASAQPASAGVRNSSSG